MNRKIILSIISVVLIAIVIFSGTAYYFNKPYMVAARAVNNTNAMNLDGSSEIKLNFDMTKIMEEPEFADNPFALIGIQAIKSALESSSLKLTYNGAVSGRGLKLDGSLDLPAILGKSTSFSVYSDGSSTWTRQDGGTWVKSEYSSSNLTDSEKKAALDFLKSSPSAVNGRTITLALKPKYSDIVKMLPENVLSSINAKSTGGLTLEEIFNALDIQINLTIDKNSILFIPRPYISKAEISIKGDLSKLASSPAIPGESKAIIEGVSFTMNGTGNFTKAASVNIEKPADIK